MLLKHDRYSANPPAHLWEFTASSLKKFLLQNNWKIIYWLVFETKAKALETCAVTNSDRTPAWRKDKDLMAFLSSL